jgi:hypothetical protein
MAGDVQHLESEVHAVLKVLDVLEGDLSTLFRQITRSALVISSRSSLHRKGWPKEPSSARRKSLTPAGSRRRQSRRKRLAPVEVAAARA